MLKAVPELTLARSTTYSTKHRICVVKFHHMPRESKYAVPVPKHDARNDY